MNSNALKFIEAATELFGSGAKLTREQIQRVVDEKGVFFPYWLVSKPEFRAERGHYVIPLLNNTSAVENTDVSVTETPASNVLFLRQKKLEDNSDSAIPSKFKGFVPFGFYKQMVQLIKSSMFYPVFITGHSGNGKTLMVEQACAELNRECIRVNISIETDESDLIGSNTLVDGNIVYRDGPVVTAMKRGSILLIDEVDRGSNKLLCLQGILEGKAYFNKKSGEYIHPKPGFNIIATANTKGRGSEEGKYLSQILDDAFLERFPITVEQNYPDSKIEFKILKEMIVDNSVEQEEFAKNLVKWAEIIRKTFNDGGVDEVISTRRLVHIMRANTIFKNKKSAIEYCVSRFDSQTKNSFIDLYNKIDATTIATAAVTETVKTIADIEDEI